MRKIAEDPIKLSHTLQETVVLQQCFLQIITEFVLEMKYQTWLILNVTDTLLDFDFTETLLNWLLPIPSKTFSLLLKHYWNITVSSLYQ